MLRRLSERFFTPQFEYDNPLDMLRARALMFMLSVGAIGTIPYSLLLLYYFFFRGSALSPALIVAAASPIVVIVTYFMVNRGYLRAGIIVVIALTIASAYLAALDTLGNADVVAVTLPIVLAGIMLGWRGTFIALAVMLILLLQVTFFSSQANTPNIAEDFGIISVILIIIGAWITVFGSNIQSATRSSLARVDDLKSILRRVSQTGIDTDEQRLSADVIDIVRDRLGYTYARIYLTDESAQVTQSISVGLNKAQLNVDTQIRLNAESAIFEAIRNRSTILLHTGSREARRSHLLPGIHSAAAIPMLVEQQVVGILDVQREEERPFEPDEVDMLALLAQHLGATIVQARLINELRENLTEQNQLVLRQRERMLEYEQAEERATISTWTAYLQQRNLEYLGFDMVEGTDEPKLSTNLPKELRSALQTGEITVEMVDDYQLVSVPILLRGRTIGAMSFKVPEGSQSIGLRQTELIRSVVQRLGLALENKRLFEQSRAQAQRESKANQVGNLLLSSTDIETVLNLAAQNFNEALGAVQTKIHLQPETRRATEG